MCENRLKGLCTLCLYHEWIPLNLSHSQKWKERERKTHSNTHLHESTRYMRNKNNLSVRNHILCQTFVFAHFRKIESFLRKWFLHGRVLEVWFSLLQCLLSKIAEYDNLPSRMILSNKMFRTAHPLHSKSFYIGPK